MTVKPEIITSPANPKIKHLRALQEKNRLRRSEKLIIVEGKKEIDRARAAHFRLKELFVCPDIARGEYPEATFISHDIFQKIAYRDTSDGLIGVFEEPTLTLDNLQLSSRPFIIIVEGVEKPGNLGAIIRSADGAGVDAVIVTDERCDIWNPHAIRASVGTIFSTQIIASSNQAVANFLINHQIKPYAAELTDTAIPYTVPDYSQATALIVGTEAEAVSDFWLERATAIQLPMHGINSSLNVSNAAAILLYEVVRQRSAA